MVLVLVRISVCARWTMSSVVRFALDISGGKIQIWVEPNLIWGQYAACGWDYNLKCAASCSIIRFLLCLGGAVEVRIVIYLSVLERWRMTSRLMVTTLGKATFGFRLFYFRAERFWSECDFVLCCCLCWGRSFRLEWYGGY